MRLLALAVVFGLSACGNAQSGRARPGPDAGLLLNVPDAPLICQDAGNLDPGSSAPSTCTPSKHRDFRSQVQPLFAGCAGEVCHDFSANRLADEVGKRAFECCSGRLVIDPGFPERSYLLDKLRGDSLCYGSRMPLEQPPLDDSEVRIIADWICEGAHTDP